MPGASPGCWGGCWGGGERWASQRRADGMGGEYGAGRAISTARLPAGCLSRWSGWLEGAAWHRRRRPPCTLPAAYPILFFDWLQKSFPPANHTMVRRPPAAAGLPAPSRRGAALAVTRLACLPPRLPLSAGEQGHSGGHVGAVCCLHGAAGAAGRQGREWGWGGGLPHHPAAAPPAAADCAPSCRHRPPNTAAGCSGRGPRGGGVHRRAPPAASALAHPGGACMLPPVGPRPPWA